MKEDTNNKQKKEIVVVKYPMIGATYQHYKGGKYKVITIAPHTETGEDFVVCQNVERSSMHNRPLSMWFGVIVPKGDASKGDYTKEVLRFELCING